MIDEMAGYYSNDPGFNKKITDIVCLAALCAYIIYYIGASKGKVSLNENELVKMCFDEIREKKKKDSMEKILIDFFVCIINKKFNNEFIRFAVGIKGKWENLISHILEDIKKTSVKEKEYKKNSYYLLVDETYKWKSDNLKTKPVGTYAEIEKLVYDNIAYGKEYDTNKIKEFDKKNSLHNLFYSIMPLQTPLDKSTKQIEFKYIDINNIIYCQSGARHEWEKGICKICGAKINEEYIAYKKFNDKNYEKLKEKVTEFDIIEHYKYFCIDGTPHQIYYGFCENCGMDTKSITSPSKLYFKKMTENYTNVHEINIYNTDIFVKIPEYKKKPLVAFNVINFDKLATKFKRVEKETLNIELFKTVINNIGIYPEKKQEEIEEFMMIGEGDLQHAKKKFNLIFDTLRYNILINMIDYIMCLFKYDIKKSSEKEKSQGEDKKSSEKEKSQGESAKEKIPESQGGDKKRRKKPKLIEEKYESYLKYYNYDFLNKFANKYDSINKNDADYVEKILNLLIEIGLYLNGENDLIKFYDGVIMYNAYSESFNITEYDIKSNKVGDSRQNELRHDIEMTLTPDIKMSMGFEYMSRYEKNKYLDKVLEERDQILAEDKNIITSEDFAGETTNIDDVMDEDDEGADMEDIDRDGDDE
jgi:hypothetical protein